MKRIKLLWLIFCCVFSAVYLVSSFSGSISPLIFPYSSFLALGFPFILLGQLFIIVVTSFIQRRWALICCVITLIGFDSIIRTFALHPSTFSSKKDPNALRVMTWNVHYFHCTPYNEDCNAVEGFIKMIAAYHPDILCLQEYVGYENIRNHPNLKKELNKLGYSYHCFSDDVITKNAGEIITYGSAIFSKFPLFNIKTVKIAENENLVYANILFQQKPLSVFTSHLKSFSLYQESTNTASFIDTYKVAYKQKRSFYHTIKNIEITHAEQVKVIRQKINAIRTPVLYCGDINATPVSYTYHSLKKNLQDAYTQKGFGLGRTFYKVLPTLRIDVSFVDQKLKVLQCKVDQKIISDHFPVITDVAWR